MEPRLFIATKAFILHQGKILILREAGTYQDGTQTGKYDIAGGRLKPGEHVEEALIREVKEEAGLDVAMGQVIAVNESWPVVRGEQWQIVRVFFVCDALTDVVQLSEDHDAYEWIDPAEYRNYGVIDNLHPVFEAYLKK